MTGARKYANEILKVTRIFNTDSSRVFDAWSQPELMMRWFGPRDFTCPVCRIDFKVGGEYLYCTRSPHGEEFWTKGVYHEIEPGRKIISADSFSDRHGNVIAASSVGLPLNWPSTVLITLEFFGSEGKTMLTLTHEGLPIELIKSSRMGWSEAFDKLQKILDEP